MGSYHVHRLRLAWDMKVVWLEQDHLVLFMGEMRWKSQLLPSALLPSPAPSSPKPHLLEQSLQWWVIYFFLSPSINKAYCSPLLFFSSIWWTGHCKRAVFWYFLQCFRPVKIHSGSLHLSFLPVVCRVKARPAFNWSFVAICSTSWKRLPICKVGVTEPERVCFLSVCLTFLGYSMGGTILTFPGYLVKLGRTHNYLNTFPRPFLQNRFINGIMSDKGLLFNSGS